MGTAAENHTESMNHFGGLVSTSSRVADFREVQAFHCRCDDVAQLRGCCVAAVGIFVRLSLLFFSAKLLL